jgi:hypothetical protein
MFYGCINSRLGNKDVLICVVKYSLVLVVAV